MEQAVNLCLSAVEDVMIGSEGWSQGRLSQSNVCQVVLLIIVTN